MRYIELIENEIQEKKFSDLKPYEQEVLSEIFSTGLTSLSGSPDVVPGPLGMNCGNNHLTTLVGGPKKVYGTFNCCFNPLTNLIGSPEEIDGNFYFGTPNLSISLTGVTTKVISGKIIAKGQVIHLMSLFNIKGIKSVDFCNMTPNISHIVNRHIGNPRGKLMFQAEMISSGCKEYL